MTVTAAPWTSIDCAVAGLGVSLVLVPPDVLAALADGDLVAAQELSVLTLTEYLVHEECIGVWRRRRDQIAGDPDDAIWVTRLVLGGVDRDGVDRDGVDRDGVDREDAGGPDDHAVVGRAGFHGAPDERGMVEIGYAIDPRFRRRGHARAALTVLLEVAAADRRVTVVRATVSPDNPASRALIDAAGFVVVGEQWDDEDGLEIVLERAARPHPLSRT